MHVETPSGLPSHFVGSTSFIFHQHNVNTCLIFSHSEHHLPHFFSQFVFLTHNYLCRPSQFFTIFSLFANTTYDTHPILQLKMQIGPPVILQAMPALSRMRVFVFICSFIWMYEDMGWISLGSFVSHCMEKSFL